MFQIFATLTLIIHLGFILFVICGSLFFFWKKKLIIFHFICLLWAVFVEFFDFLCPLTYVENWFLKMSRLPTYSNGFVEKYIFPIVYPPNLTEEKQFFFGILLIVINLFAYSFIIRKVFLNKKRINIKNE